MKNLIIATLILILSTISLEAKPFKYSTFKEKRQIINTLKKLDKASNVHNMDSVKSFYDKSYKSMDGFNCDTIYEMINETFEEYPNIKSRIKIKQIDVYGTNAIVLVEDTTTAIVGQPPKEKDDIGLGDMFSYSKYNIYLKKELDEWKIMHDEILYEETALKFGDAKKVRIHFSAPNIVQKNEPYTISLDIKSPKNEQYFALSSLNNEPIVRPAPIPKESYRKISKNAPLERIVYSNNKGLNEYAMASLGLTKVSVAEHENITSIKFDVCGMAFLMKRVNVLDYPQQKSSKVNKRAKK